MANNLVRALTAWVSSQNGFPGTFQKVFRAWGTAKVVSGQTTITVTDADVLASDIVLCTIINSPTNASTFTKVVPAAGSFVITVSADPGANGALVGYLRMRASLNQ